MTEQELRQELRQELEAEYQQKLEDAYAEMEDEMQETVNGAMKAIDDYKQDTEDKLGRYRQLSNRLNMLKEQKRLADFQHAESVEGVLKEMYDLEHKGYSTGGFSQDAMCAPMQAAKKCCYNKLNKAVKNYNNFNYAEAAMPPPPSPAQFFGMGENMDAGYGKVFTGDQMTKASCSFKSACSPKMKNVKFMAEDSGPWGAQNESPGYHGDAPQGEAPAYDGDKDDCCDEEDFGSKISNK